MAGFADKVKVLIDVDSSGAVSGLAKFKDEFKKAETATSKFKVASGAAFDFVKANAVQMGATAGAAIAGFAIKAAGDFQRLALDVDKFRDATGLTLDQASRWTEVAGDIGVDAGTIQTALNKMNKEAEKGETYFANLGIEMGKHADGTYDPQQTFLNVIDTLKRMKDPAEKATVATQILGKNWMSMADLIDKGSSQLTSAMRQVGDEKIIDEEEIQKAERLRESQDALRDALEKVSLTIGEAVIPILSDFLDAATPVIDVLGKFTGKFTDARQEAEQLPSALETSGTQMNFFVGLVATAADALGLYNKKTETATDTTFDAVKAWKDGYQALINAQEATNKLTESLGGMDNDLNGLIDTWDAFLGQLSNEEAWMSLEDKIAAAKDAAWTAFAENTPEAWRTADKARIDAQQGVADYIQKLGNVPPEIQSQILALIDQKKYDLAMRMLDKLSQPRHVVLIVEEHERIGRKTIPATTTSTSSTPGRALGGPVSPRVPYLVGERGPELFMPSGSGRISPMGGPNIVVNVSGSVTTERDLVEMIRKGLVQAQRSGNQLVY